ncbi:MAG: xanthine dehydrogenase family protein subunit M [Rhodobacteraceae bacterium]|nr:xanthine dehydrogenase family protein subunit M [Paracoccaceae bacterium]
MKAPDFRYERPESLSAALALLADEANGAQPLAGGQSLMPMLNFRVAAPEMLVDLSGVAELRGISDSGDSIRIGAMTRYRDLAEWSDLEAKLPLVALALPHIAHHAIRNRGTIGGSISLADPAAEMPALMMALDAEITLTSADGERTVPASEFFLGFYETAREENELVTSVRVPAATSGQRSAFYELAPRHGDYAMAGVAMVADAASPITNLRAAFFGIAGQPIRLSVLEAALNGKAPDDEAAITVATAAFDEVDFIDDLKASAATRRHLAGVVLKRALAEL